VPSLADADADVDAESLGDADSEADSDADAEVDVESDGVGDVLDELPSPAVTLIVAEGETVAVGVHFVSVENALTVYASGVSVTDPAVVSFNVPFMSDSFMAAPLGIAGFSRGPSIAMSAVCAPLAFKVPDGWTELAGRSMMLGFLDAACVNFQTMSTVSPTFAVAGAVISTLVVPSTGSMPAGGTQWVA
jgi:hypothetical protein